MIRPLRSLHENIKFTNDNQHAKCHFMFQVNFQYTVHTEIYDKFIGLHLYFVFFIF